MLKSDIQRKGIAVIEVIAIIDGIEGGEAIGDGGGESEEGEESGEGEEGEEGGESEEGREGLDSLDFLEDLDGLDDLERRWQPSMAATGTQRKGEGGG